MIRKIWRSLTKPVFNVALDKDSTTTDVIAGETTKICTITIYLHADQKLGNRQGEIEFPRPVIAEVPAGVEISFVDETFQGRDALQIEVFVRATACGIYSITPTFPKKKYNFKLNNIAPVDFLVIPADADSLELRKLAPVLGHGTGHSIYRGGKAELWIKVRDKFGNLTVLSNYDFKIFPENSRFVTLLSTTPYVVLGEIDSYLVTLRCDNIGRTSLGLLLPNCQLQLEIHDLEILPPPVSFLNSYVSYTNNINTMLEKRYLAGNTIAASLVLYDIFGNPISFEESKLFHDTCLVCRHVSSSSNETKTSLEEEDSLKVCSSESIRNACDLEFTPYISGKRLFHVNVDRNKIKNSSFNITVVPGPLKELQVVSQEPSSLRIYRSRTATIRVHAKDQYGNKYTGNDVNWKILTKDSFVTLFSAVYDSENGNYVVTVRGDKTGEVLFGLVASQDSYHAAKTFALEILTPPVSNTYSCFLKSNIDEIQKRVHKAGTAISLQFLLYDIFGNPISFEESKAFLATVSLACCYNNSSSRSLVTSNLRQRSDTTNKEGNSLELSSSNVESNVCDLEFTPYISGNRLFSLNSDGNEIKNSSLNITVVPGSLKEVQILSQEPSSLSIYRSRTATIRVHAKDQYGNKYTGNDVNWKMLPKDSSVALLSVTYDSQNGNQVVTVRGDKTGATSFDLIASKDNCEVVKPISMKINTPPVSDTYSYISNAYKIEKKTHEAGETIRLTLVLFDIFGNSISFEESTSFVESLRLVCHDHIPLACGCSNPIYVWEEDSFKVCSSESIENACDLEFTPYISGKRLFHLNVDGKEIKNSSLNITVVPGPLKELQVVSQEPSSLSIYRSRTATIRVHAKDQYGNRYTGNDVNWKILSKDLSVALLSVTYDSEKGNQVVTVRGDKTGATSFDLIVSKDNREVVRPISMKINTPPVSDTYSYISNAYKMQKTKHEAGETMELVLMLYDIFGNTISFEESTSFVESLRLVCSTKTKNGKKEEASLKVCPSGSNTNTCVLKFTPYTSGKRMFNVKKGENKIMNSSLNITVVPGPLKELQVVSQEPTSLRIYRSRTATIRVHAKDEYGNKYTGSEVNWKILSKDSSVALLSVTYDSEKGNYVVTVRGDKTGATSFDLISSQGVCSVTKSISMHIITPPVSHSNSYILQSEIVKLQKRIHKAGKTITFQLKLIDIFGNAISFEERGDFPANARLVFLRDGPSKWTCPTGNNSKRKEKTSLTVRPSVLDFTACELGFTPLVAGKRCFYLEIAGKRMNNSTIKLAILPGEDQRVEVEDCQGFEISGGDISSIPYKQHDYFEFYEDNRSILCMGVPRRLLVGADLANIKNINRVLEKEFSEDCKISSDVVSRGYGSVVLFELDGFTETAALKVMELLSILVEGEHYCRNQANEFANQRGKWEEKEKEAIQINYYREASQFRDLKFKCGRLMNENNENASDAVFKFYNYGRPQSEIDLHGQRVANPDSLNKLRAKLLSENKKPAEVEEVMKTQRQKRDEAIRKLDERMRAFDHEKAKRGGEDWLEIIDGAGHHSATKGQQKIRPKVKEYLKKKGYSYVEANEGALFVTFSEYIGEEPCAANFYCTKCKKTWVSISSWKGFFQRCHKCESNGIESNCYPFKLRSELPLRRQGGEFTRKDHRRLCEKCIQLGKDCRR